MHRILKLPRQDRLELFDEVNGRIGLSQRSLEKDLWVCWTLRELFSLPEVGDNLFFKGGTSLSKAWGLIDRFSEDIDVVVDRNYLGFGGTEGPEHAPSKSKQRARLDALRAVCQNCIATKIKPRLTESLKALQLDDAWNLEADAADPDGQTLLLHYPSEFQVDVYMRPTVKIELGARSDIEPFETPEIQPYVATVFPEMPGSDPFRIRVVSARRTFWEKAMLLHEEKFRPEGKAMKTRLARHYYDLWCLIQKGVAAQAVADKGLFERIAAHREVFFRWAWMDYNTLRQGTLQLLPLETQRPVWEADYEAMREHLFFNESPSFDEILRNVGEFERTFNLGGV